MHKFVKLFMLLVIASMLLAACGADATPTTAPAPTAAPTDTVMAAPPTDTAVVAVPTDTAVVVAPTDTTAPVAATDTPAAAVATDTPAGAAAATAVPPTPAPSKEGTLTLWVDKARVPALQAVAASFTKQYGVAVSIQELNFGDIRDQLKLAGPAGEGPDIIVGAHDWLGELVSNGLLEPFDNTLGGKAASFDPVSMKAFTYDGKLYGMPYGVEALALIYNKDLVPTPPATIADLEKTAKDLQDAGKVDQGYVLQQGDPYHTYPFFTGYGSYVFGTKADGSYDPTDVGLDNAGGQAAMKELDSMVKQGLLRKDVTYDVMLSLFKEGKSAMFFGGPWTLSDLRASKINYGIAPLPKMTQDSKPFVGVQGFMVSAFGKNKLLAQTFLTEFIATDASMQALYDADPRAPAWTPIAAKLSDKDIQAFNASAATGQPMPAIPQMASVWDAWGKAITLVFQQQQDPVAAIQDAAKTIRAKIAAP